MVMGWKTAISDFLFRRVAVNFLLQYRVIISSAAHPASASVLQRDIFPEVNQSEIKTDVAECLEYIIPRQHPPKLSDA
jgi:hypothetical protein